MTVKYINRPKWQGNFSFENIFDAISRELAGEIDIQKYYCSSFFDISSLLKMPLQRADAFHITGAINYLALGLPSKNTILTVHDIGRYENYPGGKIKKEIYRKIWFDLPLKHVRAITVVSAFTKQKIIDVFHIPEEKIRLIPNPVMPHFRKLEGIAKHSKFTILQIGTGPHKNLSGLIKAAQGLPVHILIIGKPNTEHLAMLKAYNLSYEVHFNISSEEVNLLYNRSELLYFASFYEGFGMPILEAQQLGIPVVTSNFGAMKEVANDAAILVDPKETDSIKDALQRVIEDKSLKENLQNLGYINASKYSCKKIALEYLALYREII